VKPSKVPQLDCLVAAGGGQLLHVRADQAFQDVALKGAKEKREPADAKQDGTIVELKSGTISGTIVRNNIRTSRGTIV